ncbi:MAG: DUF2341 domain-containing protein, partial [Candidatus Thorarchaeota archaeon]
MKKFINFKKSFQILLIIVILALNILSIIQFPSTFIKTNKTNNFIEDELPFIPTSSSGPPNNNHFKYYKDIIINHTKVSGSSNLINFPVLISLIDSDLHDEVQPDGDDIAFSNGTIWLDHEIELFDPTFTTTHAKLLVWVMIPSLSPTTDTNIIMYFGNSTMSSQQNAIGVWDSNYKGVWHLKEDPAGSSPQFKDSTSNSNHGTESNLDSDDQIDGQIDGSIDFDANQDHIDYGNDTSLNMGTGEFTLSTWFNYDGVQWGGIVGKGAYLSGGKRYYLSFNTPAGQIMAEIDDDSAPLNPSIISGAAYGDNKWHHLAMVRDETYLRLYLDGNEDGTKSVTGYGNIDSKHPLYMNAKCDINGQISSWSSVKLDEVRVSNCARSADWIKTEYNNQNDTKSFYSVYPAKKNLSPNDFEYYKDITINHTKISGSTDLLNFPLLVSIKDSDLHDHTQPDGDDISFYNGSEWLDHEIETFNQNFNETHAQLVAWIRIPKLSTSADTVIRMYYGNSSLASQENPAGVWKSNYKGVWHLKENPSGANINDSTLNNLDGSPQGNMNSSDQVNAQLDGGIDFDGNDDNIATEENDFLASVSSFTMSAWIKPLSSQSDFCGIIEYDNTTDGSSFDAGMELRSTRVPRVNIWTTTGFKFVDSSTVLPTTKFTYFVFVYDGNLSIYVDGSFDCSTTHSGNVRNNRRYINIGRNTHDGVSFNGIIDEIRISNVARSPDWIETIYNNENDPNSFYSIGKEYREIKIEDFPFHKEIKIDHNKVSGTDDLFNFPVLISLIDSDLHDYAQADGDDIAFFMNDTRLDHEIELFDNSYNDTHAKLVAWVRVPSLSPFTDTIIKMYYGNSSISSQEFPEGVWNSYYSGVWHLHDDLKDSTVNQNDGTNHGSTDAVGQIADAQDFAGYSTDQEITIGPNKTLNPTSITVSAWINPRGQSSGSETGMIVSDYDWTDNFMKLYYLYMHPNNRIYVTVFWDDGITTSDLISQPITLNEWHLVHFTVNSTTLALYIDGHYITPEYPYNATTPITGGIKQYLNMIEIGSEEQMSSCEHEFNGTIDDVRILNTDLSVDWISTEYNNQNNPSTFYTISSQKVLDNAPPTYSNLIESEDPLELGDTEIISINVSDSSGINQVKIEFEGSNHSMVNIVGETWQYTSWTPTSVNNYTYTIWIEDNYKNWNFTSGSIEVIDTTAPTYSDLIESADPLQIGQNETINIKVYDSPGSGVNQVLLEYDSLNHSMNFIVGNTWRWTNWKPNLPGNHSYKIYMQDIENNWNWTSGTINVISTTAPSIENLTESESPLELGHNITITADVADNETYVSVVLFELGSVNYTMKNSIDNSYFITLIYNFNWSNPSVGTIGYKIYANDSDNNWNSLSSSFDIVDTVLPNYLGLIESEDPLEFGNNEVISINCTDLAGINQVKIEFGNVNHSMTNVYGNTWQYDLWTPSTTGIFPYTIWIEDNNNHWNYCINSILVQDTILPEYSDLIESADPIELGNTIRISINCTDLAGIKQVNIEFGGINHSMSSIGGDIWQYNIWTPLSTGNSSYIIWIEDNNQNWNYVQDYVLVQDTIAPTYSNLIESTNPVELGSPLMITITITDLGGINQAFIEFENTNHSMVNIGGDIWQYNSWMPNSIGNYSYMIYMRDGNNNWNYTSSSIIFKDTIAPIYSNLIESADPLELGSSITIRINVNDFAGINQTLIEFEGSNHSMLYIGGNLWEYSSWIPNNRIVYQYRIFMEDNSGNWNNVIGNITVQDITPPLAPVITNAPSGDVNGILTFDWLDGSDPSGISFYILIIDNETDPLITPGYIHFVNITNEGTESSYYELPYILSSGRYYYFLYQIDGVGHQSSSTMGTFTVISGNTGDLNNSFIIIIIIIAISVGSIATIIIVKKNAQKKAKPPRKKIPLKHILPHINKISIPKRVEIREDKMIIEPRKSEEAKDLADLDQIELDLIEIKASGEELFNEGAYLEAQKQFELAKNMLLNLGRNEDAKLFSELIEGIGELINKRENLLKILERAKVEGNVVKLFEIYYDLTQISKKLRDSDALHMFQLEFIQIFQND